MALTWSVPVSGASTNFNIRKAIWAPAPISLWIAVGNRTGNIGSGGNLERVLTSPDGITWTMRNAAKAYNWASVAYSPTLQLLVAVTSSTDETIGGTDIFDQVMTSTDGITWTDTHNSAERLQWNDIVWADTLGLFVAVGVTGTNRVMTSVDGSTWLPQSAAAVKNWGAIEWSNSLGKLVATASDSGTSSVMYSSNGTAWTAGTTNATSAFGQRNLAWAPGLGKFVACSTSSHLFTSSDGINWSDWSGTPSGWGSTATAKAAWSEDLSQFVVTKGSGSSDVLVSSDGVVWTVENVDEGTFSFFAIWDAIAYSSTLKAFALFVQNDEQPLVLYGQGLAQSVSPTSGTAAGGTTITLSGDASNGGFVAGTRVFLDYDTNFGSVDPETDILNGTLGIECTDVVIVDPGTITCTTPVQGPSPVTKTIIAIAPILTPNVVFYLQDGFTTLLPVAVSVAPTSGSVAGGTALTLTGTNLFEGNGDGSPGEMVFGGTAGTAHVFVNATTITCLTPAHAAGVVSVVYTPPQLSYALTTFTYPATTLAAAYTYQPSVSAIEVPVRYDDGIVTGDEDEEGGVDGLDSFNIAGGFAAGGIGCSAGGTPITITGAGFAAGAAVTVGGVSATSIVVVSSTRITCISPAHADGLVNIVITNTDATTVTVTGGFKYLTPWWLRRLTVIIDGETFTFETWVNSCTPPVSGVWVLPSITAPTFKWWTLPVITFPSGATRPAQQYRYQVNTPGPGWVETTAPVSNDGWFYSTEAFGGSITVVTGGVPHDPRTWANISAWATAGTGMLGGSPAASCVFANRTFFPATGYTVGTHYPPIYVFDGGFNHELAQLPPTSTNGVPKAVMSMLSANGTIYLTSFDSGTSSADWAGRVFELDRISGILTPIGAPFTTGEMPYALAWHMGRLWLGTNNGIGTVGKVYYFRPDIDTAWTLDHSLSTESLGGVDSMLSYKGKLYVGSDNAAGSRGKILVRDSAGAYTVSDTGSGGTASVNNGYLAMAVFEDNLYASYWNDDTPDTSLIRKFDNTSWTTAYTGASTTLRPFILLLVDSEELFAIGGGGLMTGAIVRTDDGTTWTNLTAQLPESDKTLLPIYGVEIL